MTDREWMREALKEAKAGALEGEVPVGAILVKENRIVSRAHNLCRSDQDPTEHAEMLVLTDAVKKIGLLEGCTLYVTLEPCAMCAGAMIQARLPRLVFGAYDAACGCCGSRIDLGDHWFDHSIETIGGILEMECADLLLDFFVNLR